ncbi:MAG: alpha/beta fold hydrolase [Thiohalocapsa sp.]
MIDVERLFQLPGFTGRLFGTLAGDEPRVLLLHGFTGDGRDWAPWSDDRPTALAIDLPGHGGSQDPIVGFAEEIERLLNALPPSIDQVIGYSLGGRIALSLLAVAPERFRAATILSAHPGLVNADQRAARRAADLCWIELLRTQGIAAFVDAWERQPLFATQAALPPTVLETWRARRLGQRAEGLANNLACFGLAEMPETWTALSRWSGRLRWLVGALDSKFAAIAEQVLRQCPEVELHRIEQVGHNLLLEAPQAVLCIGVDR